MLYMILVFGHLLATSMALGAIVATDLRMLSKLSHEKVRIAPPNDFVARLVMIALVMLYATGGVMLFLGARQDPDFLLNPKLHGKLVLVLLLTFNAVVLHRLTFPRLARGRSVGRWRLIDWVAIVLPVSLSNCLWMFCAFLGIARPWNHAISMGEVLAIAATLYVLALLGVGLVLAAAARRVPQDRAGGPFGLLKRALASVGNLGQEARLPDRPVRRRRSAVAPTPLAEEGAAWQAPVGRRRA